MVRKMELRGKDLNGVSHTSDPAETCIVSQGKVTRAARLRRFYRVIDNDWIYELDTGKGQEDNKTLREGRRRERRDISDTKVFYKHLIYIRLSLIPVRAVT